MKSKSTFHKKLHIFKCNKYLIFKKLKKFEIIFELFKARLNDPLSNICVAKNSCGRFHTSVPAHFFNKENRKLLEQKALCFPIFVIKRQKIESFHRETNVFHARRQMGFEIWEIFKALQKVFYIWGKTRY